jgi:hypothetical protein
MSIDATTIIEATAPVISFVAGAGFGIGLLSGIYLTAKLAQEVITTKEKPIELKATLKVPNGEISELTNEDEITLKGNCYPYNKELKFQGKLITLLTTSGNTQTTRFQIYKIKEGGYVYYEKIHWFSDGQWETTYNHGEDWIHVIPCETKEELFERIKYNKELLDKVKDKL